MAGVVVGPSGAVPGEVDGISERGRPEMGDTSGRTGAGLTPLGSVAAGFATGAVPGIVERAAPVLSGDCVGIVGDMFGVPGVAVVGPVVAGAVLEAVAAAVGDAAAPVVTPALLPAVAPAVPPAPAVPDPPVPPPV